MLNRSWRLQLFSWQLHLSAQNIRLVIRVLSSLDYCFEFSCLTRSRSCRINHDYPMNYLLDDEWTIAMIISSWSKEEVSYWESSLLKRTKVVLFEQPWCSFRPFQLQFYLFWHFVRYHDNAVVFFVYNIALRYRLK